MNYKTREDIQSRVNEHYKEADKLGHKIFMTAAQGSMNYGGKDLKLFDGESDVDTKCLIIPPFRDIVLGKQMISTTHEMENKEHLDLKDFRKYFHLFKKQNINILEILFTDFVTVNPMYEAEFRILKNNREDLAHYDPSRALATMVGMAKEKQKALCHPYPTIKWKIDKYGFDGKQLYTAYRLHEFMKKYIDGESYEKCLESDMAEFLNKVKRNELYSVNSAVKIMEHLVEDMEKWREEGNKKLKVDKDLQNHLDDILEDISVLIMRKAYEF